VLLDATPVFEEYGIGGLPCTFVVDREGKVASRHIGFGPGLEAKFEDEVRRLLGLQASAQ
jgi:hypothetical protein